MNDIPLLIIRILSFFSGIMIFIHFICKANFMNHKKTPKIIAILTCFIISSSVSIIFHSALGTHFDLLASFLITTVFWFIVDFMLWFHGYPVSDFYEKR